MDFPARASGINKSDGQYALIKQISILKETRKMESVGTWIC